MVYWSGFFANPTGLVSFENRAMLTVLSKDGDMVWIEGINSDKVSVRGYDGDQVWIEGYNSDKVWFVEYDGDIIAVVSIRWRPGRD